MIDKTITKEELLSFLKVKGKTTNGEIFKVCRDFFDDLKENHDMNVLNMGEIYWWIRNERDRLQEAVV